MTIQKIENHRITFFVKFGLKIENHKITESHPNIHAFIFGVIYFHEEQSKAHCDEPLIIRSEKLIIIILSTKKEKMRKKSFFNLNQLFLVFFFYIIIRIYSKKTTNELFDSQGVIQSFHGTPLAQ